MSFNEQDYPGENDGKDEGMKGGKDKQVVLSSRRQQDKKMAHTLCWGLQSSMCCPIKKCEPEIMMNEDDK